MYAVVRTGGKQYKVKVGDLMRVEKLDRQLGDEFDLTEILAVGGESQAIGRPELDNAKVTVVVTQQSKAAKIIVFKKKRRQGYRRTQGHRQQYTELFVKTIVGPNGEVSKAEATPVVVDPVKIAQRKAEARKQEKKEGKKKATAKKRTAKKAAKKKKTAKKAAKKTGKKKATKKKTAKKAKKS